MFGSNMPSVLGIVNITAANSSFKLFSKSDKSVLPSLSDFKVITSKPAILAEAGLVPCALSGINTLVLLTSPFDK